MHQSLDRGQVEGLQSVEVCTHSVPTGPPPAALIRRILALAPVQGIDPSVRIYLFI